MTFPPVLQDYVWQRTVVPGKAAYAELDGEGIVITVGGGEHLFGYHELHQGMRVQDALPYMEGLLPLEGEPLVLERIATSSDTHVDVHLIPAAERYFLLVVDVTETVRREADFLQRANELALIKRGQGMQHSELRDLLGVLDMLAAVRDDTGRLIPIGKLPAWAGQFVPLLDSPLDDWSTDTALAYLASFLEEARDLWDSQRPGFRKSGLWIHADHDGEEFLYEATAAYTGTRNVLLVGRHEKSSLEKQSILQKGRDLALSKHELQRERATLETTRDQLEDRVRERTRELEMVNDRLTEALKRRSELEEERAAIIEQAQQSHRIEALGTLAGGIAHDFNNILAAIVGFTEAGLDQVSDGGETEGSLSGIMEAATRAQELVKQILVMSRQAETETRPVRLKGVVDEVLRLMRATLPVTIDIVSDLETDALVEGNAAQIHQVVANLCTNARHAMGKYGGILRIGLREVELREQELDAYPDLWPGRYAVLEVRDTGVGIPEAILPKIFDPFFTTKGPGEGTGIGLSVVYGIVTSAKGAVTVDGVPGSGTVFRVFWPLTVQSEAAEPDMAVRPVEGKERILFVDDEPMQAALALKMLGKMGYEVVALTDSRQALKEFTANPDGFDLLVTDLTMPELSGEALVMKVLKLRPEFPVVVCTGYAEPDSETALIKAGVRKYLVKPMEWRRIGETIREELDNVARSQQAD